MKKSILLLCLCYIALYSCEPDDNDNILNNQLPDKNVLDAENNILNCDSCDLSGLIDSLRSFRSTSYFLEESIFRFRNRKDSSLINFTGHFTFKNDNYCYFSTTVKAIKDINIKNIVTGPTQIVVEGDGYHILDTTFYIDEYLDVIYPEGYEEETHDVNIDTSTTEEFNIDIEIIPAENEATDIIYIVKIIDLYLSTAK